MTMQETSRVEISDLDRKIVELIAEGLTRWAIAERIGISEFVTRERIRGLCARFDCNMRSLPDVLEIGPASDVRSEEIE